jgi:hypothetical protein
MQQKKADKIVLELIESFISVCVLTNKVKENRSFVAIKTEL